jgi:CTP synthase
MSAKYVFVTGGVVSSLGKGLAAASIGCLLESRGLRVNLMKFDPYLNVDPGTMSPFQHGEVFVTDDGAETDLDLGHYERFTHAPLSRDNNLTTGRIYEQIIPRSAAATTSARPSRSFPTSPTRSRTPCARSPQRRDVTIVEIGGTVGDIESLPFLEAIRQMRQELGRENTVFVHLTLVPWIAAAQELKTKPTQHSVKELLSIGIQADILLCRSDRALSREIKQKIAAFCNVEERAVIGAATVPPSTRSRSAFAEEGVDELILKYLHKEAPEADMTKWRDLVDRCYHPKDEVSIAIVGKYVEYEDSYKSLKEALTHGASRTTSSSTSLDRSRGPGIHRTPDDRSYESQLEGFDGILVPGGFGKRGIEGMLNAIRYAREKNVPYFGICLGMQTACIEFARNVCGLKDANSSEFDPATPSTASSTSCANCSASKRWAAPCASARGPASCRKIRSPSAPTAAKPRSASATAIATSSTASTKPCSPAPACASAAPHARRNLRRDRRDPRPPLLPRLPVPSRVQVQAPRAAPALPRVHHGASYKNRPHRAILRDAFHCSKFTVRNLQLLVGRGELDAVANGKCLLLFAVNRDSHLAARIVGRLSPFVRRTVSVFSLRIH